MGFGEAEHTPFFPGWEWGLHFAEGARGGGGSSRPLWVQGGSIYLEVEFPALHS